MVGRAVRVMRRTKHDVTTRRRRVGWDCSGGLKQAGARMGKKTSLHLLCCAVCVHRRGILWELHWDTRRRRRKRRVDIHCMVNCWREKEREGGREVEISH